MAMQQISDAPPTKAADRKRPSNGSFSIPNPPFLEDANSPRKIIQLLQCRRCGKPLTNPVTPCAFSICKQCIPPCHTREHISYPTIGTQAYGCEECYEEHALENVSPDITLSKVVAVLRYLMANRLTILIAMGLRMMLSVQFETRSKRRPSEETSARTTNREYDGCPLVATYQMATAGDLPYGSELVYKNTSDGADDAKLQAVDASVLKELKEKIRPELDCQVCLQLLLEPFTTPCGHTFCRSCINRVFDHGQECPFCRRMLRLPGGSTNSRLERILEVLYPSETAERKSSSAEAQEPTDLDTPIFVCTLAFPTMPCYLHIFEPRYRLLIRRAMENENRKFGMVLYNGSQEEQGELGTVDFCQYGTMLEIIEQQLMSDGRSMIHTKGLYRFKVLRHGMLDGYKVAKVQRLEDISLAEEVELEAMEVRPCTHRSHQERQRRARERSFAADHYYGEPPSLSFDPNPARGELCSSCSDSKRSGDLSSLPTSDYIKICSDFVASMRRMSAPWLHERGGLVAFVLENLSPRILMLYAT